MSGVYDWSVSDSDIVSQLGWQTLRDRRYVLIGHWTLDSRIGFHVWFNVQMFKWAGPNIFTR